MSNHLAVVPTGEGHIHRRDFLIRSAAATAAFALEGCRRARADELIWALGWVPNVEYPELWIALDKNYLGASGVTMKYFPGGPNAPQPTVSVAAGQASMGDAEWLPFCDAILQGNDFVILCAFFPILPTGLISLPRRPVRTPAELRGARFLVQGPTERNELQAIFRLNKLPDDYTLVPVGFSPEPLIEGQGDAYFCFVNNQPLVLEDMGLKRDKDFYVTRIFDLGYQVPSSLLFVHRSTITHQRDKLVIFMKAMLRASIDNAADPTLAARLCVEKYGGDLGLDLDQQIKLNRSQPELQTGPGASMPFWFSQQQITQRMYPAAEAVGKRGLPPPSKIFDLTILEQAHRELVEEGIMK